MTELFQDFALIQVDHLDRAIVRELYQMIMEKNIDDPVFLHECREKLVRSIRYGRQAILRTTQPGDLVLFETPEKENYISFLSKTHKTDSPELRRIWELVLNLHYNIYWQLSQFAEKNKRMVGTLESSAIDRLRKLVARSYSLKMRDQYRLEYLIANGRSQSMIRRISRRKPAAIVTAAGHAWFIEKKMNPKKVCWSDTSKRFFVLRNPQNYSTIFRWIEERYKKFKQVRKRLQQKRGR
ncbi:MAG: hypothetical protein HY393_01740 [Candidatus Diapherotrites archaeon]|nr:hypothetical protein [Candidatus Diapherotrites archaeon]